MSFHFTHADNPFAGIAKDTGNIAHGVPRRRISVSKNVSTDKRPTDPSPTPLPIKNSARRGDLVAVVAHHRGYVIGQGSYDRVDVELRFVHGISRDGLVKVTRTIDGSGDGSIIKREHELYKDPEYLLIPKSAIDVDAAVAAYRDHLWRPESEIGYRHVKPFDSIEECREFLLPFRK